MGGIGKSIGVVTKGLNVSPIMQSAFGSIADAGDQRAAFNAIMLATAANALKKPNFNLEVEINDLNVRLGNLRGMSSGQGLGGLAQQLGNATSILGSLDSAMKGIVNNLGK
jgi:hypothetical protein